MTKLVLVTGGSRGIGATIAKSFSHAGYKVAITYSKNKNKARNIVSNLQGDAFAFKLDQSNSESIQHCLSQITEHFQNSIDVLVNNAAISQEKSFFNITADDFSKMLDTNLRGPFLLAQACIAGMKQKQFGKIINISSIGGQWGGINQVHYAASKAGLINLTKSIAKVYSSDGICANTIAVGLVDTDMAKAELASPEGRKKIKTIPVGRIATPDDIAKISLFLASNDSDYVTGQTINANGGMYFG